MTLYAGEKLIVTHTATLEGTALTDAEVTSVTITIYNSAGTELVAETTMSWDATDARWEYVWVTDDGAATPTALPTGTYRAKVVVTDLTSKQNWEYKRIRLASNPV
jgi:hypothetical protein